MTPVTITGTYNNAIVSKIKRWVRVRFQKSGIHCYPAAATDLNLKTGDYLDVSFLANTHHHIFFFDVQVEVFQNDRDIEFIQLQRWCEKQYEDSTLQLNSQSCEMLAENLIIKIKDKFPGRDIKVGVYEDNINGGILEYTALTSTSTMHIPV